jgi:glycosyltransferase involved in cell wall biosynthesis
MRLAVLMAVASPWSREIVRQLAQLRAEIHAIDYATVAPANYFSGKDESQAADLSELSRTVAGVHVLRTNAPGAARHFFAARQLRRIVNELEADVVLTLYGGGFANLAWLSGFRPYVVYVVGSDVLLSRGLRTILSRRAFGKAALVVANGQYLAKRTREVQPAARIETLYYGVNTDELVPGPPISQPRVVCTRGFLPVYNNAYLVEGLAALGEAAPLDLEVTFVAPGPELAEVRRLADRILPAGVRAHVHFPNGLGRAALIAELQRSQVYVSLSRSDGTSTSLLEALACGLFPVLSDIPQNREWVTPEENNGILVPFDEPKVLAQALQRALADSEWRARAAKHNRQKTVERASAPRNMAKLLDMLEHIQ